MSAAEENRVITNKDIDNHNLKKLEVLQEKIIKIDAVNTNKFGKTADSDQYNGLVNELYLSIGCRVTLVCNLWYKLIIFFH